MKRSERVEIAQAIVDDLMGAKGLDAKDARGTLSCAYHIAREKVEGPVKPAKKK